MGLFDVNMPLLYGEKSKAFIRLQEEIIRKTGDQSILAWASTRREGYGGFLGRDLASSPDNFAHAKIKKKWSLEDPRYGDSSRRQINITKEGLEVDLFCFRLPRYNHLSLEEDSYLAILDCTLGDNPLAQPAIIIEKPPWGASDIFVRNRCSRLYVMTPRASDSLDDTVPRGIVKVAAHTMAGEWTVYMMRHSSTHYFR